MLFFCTISLISVAQNSSFSIGEQKKNTNFLEGKHFITERTFIAKPFTSCWPGGEAYLVEIKKEVNPIYYYIRKTDGFTLRDFVPGCKPLIVRYKFDDSRLKKIK